MDGAVASSPPLLTPYEKLNFSPLQYGLLLMALTVILVVVYNLILFLRCPQHLPWRFLRGPSQFPAQRRGETRNLDLQLNSSIEYCKERHAQDSHGECAVCLSTFLDGEEIRQLPLCKHCFHKPCIDMWLSSHSNCPLCRATLAGLRPKNQVGADEEDFRQGLPDSGTLI